LCGGYEAFRERPAEPLAETKDRFIVRGVIDIVRNTEQVNFPDVDYGRVEIAPFRVPQFCNQMDHSSVVDRPGHLYGSPKNFSGGHDLGL
jgi:hypothetical protein